MGSVVVGLQTENDKSDRKTVADLIKELQEFPMDAIAYAYEGESCGIAIGRMGSLGFIFTEEG